jgi:hypothetical protein
MRRVVVVFLFVLVAFLGYLAVSGLTSPPPDRDAELVARLDAIGWEGDPLELSAGYRELATLRLAEGRHLDAEGPLRLACQFAEDLERPAGDPTRLDLAADRIKLGECLAAQGKHDQAVKESRKGLTIFEREFPARLTAEVRDRVAAVLAKAGGRP